ncbi:hypothetical protein F5Y01DRAFT_329123 [Xylaria sp. FL0043]|nr:hypothetical protein F5Y01DRAFT_329123 [Xylaria sp. FL0043]
MRGTFFVHVALVCLRASFLTSAKPIPGYPTRTLGNVTVVDTKLVREAQVFARSHSSDVVWGHVLRSWLFGTLIISHNDTLRTTVDAEAHALAVILHDLGWDQAANSTTVSADRRFEVDGAIAARDFTSSHNDGRGSWDDHRLQLVWDSIALHTQESIYQYKQDTVAVTGFGILMDFEGPSNGVTQQEYNAVLAAVPKVEFEEAVNQTFVWLCTTKPQTTYDTFMQPWGDNFVTNYSAKGYRIFDTITSLPL